MSNSDKGNFGEEGFTLGGLREATVNRRGKAWRWEVKWLSVHQVHFRANQKSETDGCLPLLNSFPVFSFLFSLRPQAVGWCHPHIGWSFPHHKCTWTESHIHSKSNQIKHHSHQQPTSSEGVNSVLWDLDAHCLNTGL